MCDCICLCACRCICVSVCLCVAMCLRVSTYLSVYTYVCVCACVLGSVWLCCICFPGQCSDAHRGVPATRSRNSAPVCKSTSARSRTFWCPATMSSTRASVRSWRCRRKNSAVKKPPETPIHCVPPLTPLPNTAWLSQESQLQVTRVHVPHLISLQFQTQRRWFFLSHAA